MGIGISIIVPVYNLEDLLTRCIDSILAQTYTNFELILVNDGSTDGSGTVCQQYADADPRVKVIHKKNGGVASARNAGLDAASGTYIGFVDNDDYIHPSMFETLYHTATTHSSDIVVCDFLKVDKDDQRNEKTKPAGYQVDHYNHIEASQKLFTERSVTFVCPWNKLYEKRLFDGIRYEEGSINDDETVAHELYYISRKTTYIHSALYYYVQRSESQTGSFSIKRLDAVYALKRREVFYKSKKEAQLHQKALLQYVEKFFWYYFLAKASLKNIDKELKQLKSTFDKTLLSLLKHKEISWQQKIMFLLFRVHPAIFEYIRERHSKQQAKVL